jgi:hypothetical protein
MQLVLVEDVAQQATAVAESLNLQIFIVIQVGHLAADQDVNLLGAAQAYLTAEAESTVLITEQGNQVALAA